MQIRISWIRTLAVLLLGLLLGFSPGAAADELEVLHLSGGDRLSGYHRGFADGAVVWEMPYGGFVRVPLSQVERVEYSLRGADESRTAAESRRDGGGGFFRTEIEQTSLGGETASLTPYPESWQPPIHARAYWYRATKPLGPVTGLIWETFDNWVERLEFGGRFLDGNSEEDNINLLGRFEHEWGRTTWKADSGGQLGRANGRQTTNRWYGNTTVDVAANDPKWVMFVLNRNEYDEFESLDYRGSLAAGLGYRFYNDKARRLIFRLGPGVTHERFDKPELVRTTPDLLAEFEFRWPIFDRTEIEHKSTVNPSLEDLNVFRLISDYGLLVRLDPNERWSVKIGMRHEYNSRPNLNREASDFTTGILLVYQLPNVVAPSLTNKVFPPRASIFQPPPTPP